MNFDEQLYSQLLAWAKSLLKTRKIDNLTEHDLINESYLKLLTDNKLVTADEIKKIAYSVFHFESGLASSKDNNWLEIGEGNPNYKAQSTLLSHYVCKKCMELKPQAEFTIRNRNGMMVVESQCKICINKKSLNKRVAEKGYVIKPTTSLTVYNQCGEVLYKGLSVADVAFRLGLSEYRVRKIINNGKRYKNIYKYKKTNTK